MAEAETETGRQLRHRDLLAELGTAALRGRDLDDLLTETSRIIADGMGTTFAKVLEYLPGEQALLVRAGVGWRDGVVGHAMLGADNASPAGFALRTAEPVISDDLATDSRFRTPALLLEHGVRRAINVIIKGDGKPFGVLEADSRLPGTFLPSDVAFLQAAANLVGVALERSRREQELEAALTARDLLLREADHRIKNSLQLVASLLSMQRSRLCDDEGTLAALDGAISRVRAVAEAHRALFHSRDLQTIEFGRMLEDIGLHVGTLSPSVTVQCEADAGLDIHAERAIPLGLVANELLTNAVRHAYAAGQDGAVTATARREGDDIVLTVADRGRGIAPEQAPRRSLGSTIVAALAKQVGARITTETAPGTGTTVVLRVPLASAT